MSVDTTYRSPAGTPPYRLTGQSWRQVDLEYILSDLKFAFGTDGLGAGAGTHNLMRFLNNGDNGKKATVSSGASGVWTSNGSMVNAGAGGTLSNFTRSLTFATAYSSAPAVFCGGSTADLVGTSIPGNFTATKVTTAGFDMQFCTPGSPGSINVQYLAIGAP